MLCIFTIIFQTECSGVWNRGYEKSFTIWKKKKKKKKKDQQFRNLSSTSSPEPVVSSNFLIVSCFGQKCIVLFFFSPCGITWINLGCRATFKVFCWVVNYNLLNLITIKSPQQVQERVYFNVLNSSIPNAAEYDSCLVLFFSFHVNLAKILHLSLNYGFTSTCTCNFPFRSLKLHFYKLTQLLTYVWNYT